ncbi:MAG: ATP-dependent zinc metalloprotease FtsH [Clostridiales bacterium]|nr:ATP-dependent zinc metalloprotease FtsH [Clostridiales bacterium]
MLYSSQQTETPQTSDLVQYFIDDEVKSYTVNYGSGAIEITLKDGVSAHSDVDADSTSATVSIATESTTASGSTGSANSGSAASNVVVSGELADIQRFLDVIEPYQASADEAIEYDLVKASDNSLLYELIPTILITVLLIGVWIYFMRRMGGGGFGGREMSFGKAKIKNTNDDKCKTTFDDVAGADEEKEELQEVVEFLKAPDKFNKLGARIPKGVLLVGPPGTGKTLLARAVAGEAGVPFFSISGSDFVEMFVGVGASRVRDLFDQAKKNSPCIVFIDEIDAVGRQRGVGLGGGNDEREQTLNQLLVEMDGFGVNEGVILIAATNRPDVLDPALMRPGRFDRQVVVSYPDVNGREAILKVHARKKPLAPDVKLKTIAKTTAGFTGADLENLLNEAALLAARKNKKAITMKEIEEATVKVVVGAEKKSKVMSEKEKKLTAYHEAGHAILFEKLPTQDPVHEISIIPRGMAGGYTMPLPSEDKSYNSRNEMLDDIVVSLGGRVAEALILDDISTGASNDIEKATKTARSMVTKYGMTKELGCVCYGADSTNSFISREMGGSAQDYSEATAAKIDELVLEIVNNAYDRAEKILSDNVDKLHETAAYLIKHEKMNGEDFKAVMDGTYVEPPEEDEESEAEFNTAENGSEADNTSDSEESTNE